MKNLGLVAIFVTLLMVMVSAPSLANVTLEVWFTEGNEQFRVIQDMVDEFFTPKTGISVRGVVLTYDDLWQRGLMALATGDVPDVASFGTEWPAEFGIRGGLVDLRSEFGDEFLELEKLLFPGQLRAVEYLGTSYGYPIRFGFGLTYYRTDIFEQYGWEFPRTWDEVFTLLPRMQARNMNLGTSVWYLLPHWATLMQFVWQAGGDVITDDLTRSGLNTPEAIGAFERMMRLFTEFKIPGESVPLQAFSTGDYPIMVGGNWNYTAIQLGFPQIAGKWSPVLFPGTMVDGKINHTVYNGGVPFGIFSASPHRKEAWEFIKWFASTETQIEFGRRVLQAVPGYYFFSSNMEAARQVDFPEADVAIMFEQAMQSRTPRFAPGAVVISQRHMTNAAMEVLLTGATPKEAIGKAAHLMNQEMDQKQREFARFISRYVQ